VISLFYVNRFYFVAITDFHAEVSSARLLTFIFLLSPHHLRQVSHYCNAWMVFMLSNGCLWHGTAQDIVTVR